MKEKKISIIIPCYNSEKYIVECFDSVVKQTLGIENLQIIFVNDASTDNTINLLSEFEKCYPQSVQVIDLKVNKRQGGARNEGLSCATGKYVMFLDSDDWLDITACEKVYQTAEKYQVDILQFPFIHVYGENQMVTDESVRYGFLDGAIEEIKRGMFLGVFFTFGSQNKLYRRELLQKENAHFPEKRVYEEPYFVYPLLFPANRFYNVEEGLYYYRQTQQSVTVQIMNQDTKLYDHPEVQLALLKRLFEKRDFIESYYEEIEVHFLHSYYMETLYFAGKSNLYLGIDYFKKMQQIILQLFPEYEINVYLKYDGFEKLKKILESVKMEFNQDELNAYCKQVVEILD